MGGPVFMADRERRTWPKTSLVLNQLNLVARDFDATLAFYRRLGVEIPEQRAPGEIRYAEVTLANGSPKESPGP